ncbi:MAG: hypothetical protein V1729_05265 [Candidatus Woesearchaeota archaeon]
MVKDIDELIDEKWQCEESSRETSIEGIPDVFTPKAFLIDTDDKPADLESRLQLIADVKNYSLHLLDFEPSPNYMRYTDNDKARTLNWLFVRSPQGVSEEYGPHVRYNDDLSHRIFPDEGMIIHADDNNLKEEEEFYKKKGYDTHRRRIQDFNDGHGCDLTPRFFRRNITAQVKTVLHEDWHHTYNCIVEGHRIPRALDESAAHLIGHAGAYEFTALRYGKDSRQHNAAHNQYIAMQQEARVLKKAFDELQEIGAMEKEGKSAFLRRKKLFFWLKVKGYDCNAAYISEMRPYTKHIDLFTRAYECAGSVRGFVDVMDDAHLDEQKAIAYIKDFINYG